MSLTVKVSKCQPRAGEAVHLQVLPERKDQGTQHAPLQVMLLLTSQYLGLAFY